MSDERLFADVGDLDRLDGNAGFDSGTAGEDFVELAVARERRIQRQVGAALDAFGTSKEVHTGVDLPTLEALFRSHVIDDDLGSLEAYARFFTEVILRHSVNVGSPRCLGHMSASAPKFMRLFAEAVAGLNQNLAKRDASRVLTLVERQTLAILHSYAFGLEPEFYRQLIQDPSRGLGTFTSGGTTANLVALWCARNRCFAPDGEFGGVERDGMGAALASRGARRAVILSSALAHYSITKAAGILGLGERAVIEVPVDSAGALRATEVERILRRCRDRAEQVVAVVGTAGTTECGSIDALGEIAEIAATEDLYFHVDAAWGGALLFSESESHRLAGIERADSITIDGHKQLCIPVGASALLFRCPKSLSTLEKQASYMLRKGAGDLGAWSLEGSRPAASLLLHAGLHVIGPAGYGELIEGHMERTRAMARMIEISPAFELLFEPQTNIVLYRYRPPCAVAVNNVTLNELNIALQSRQSDFGKTFVSRTTVTALPPFREQPVVALRAVINNPQTTDEDIEAVLADQLQIASELDPRYGTGV